jgi:hypothetical protein
VTDALAEAVEADDVVEALDWLAAYCCRALRNSDNSWAPSVEALEALALSEALLVSLLLEVELVELVLEVELADAVASDGGGPP